MLKDLNNFIPKMLSNNLKENSNFLCMNKFVVHLFYLDSLTFKNYDNLFLTFIK